MPPATLRPADVTPRWMPAGVVGCVASFDSAIVRMQSTHATVLNTVVRVQRFVVINDKTIADIDQLDDREVLDDVVKDLVRYAVNQTSATQAVEKTRRPDARAGTPGA